MAGKQTGKSTPPPPPPPADEIPKGSMIAPTSEPARDLAPAGGGIISYPGVASKPFPAEAQKVLNKDFTWDEIEITPDGRMYAPGKRFSDRLDQAFGQGAWALVRQTKWEILHNQAMATFHLYVDGRYVAEATGGQAYHPTNDNMSYDDAIEGATTNALMRCCKKIGVGRNLWDPNFRRSWRKQYAKQFWAKNENTGKTKVMWKRQDDDEDFAYPWRKQAEKPQQEMPKSTKTRPQASRPPAPSQKAKGTPAPSGPAVEGADGALACSIIKTVPVIKAGTQDLWRYEMEDETGAKWWGGTKDSNVADVLTSCFNSGSQVEVEVVVHDGIELREIRSADPVTG